MAKKGVQPMTMRSMMRGFMCLIMFFMPMILTADTVTPELEDNQLMPVGM